MKVLSIDIETFSDIDLTKSGVYKYVESPYFDILLFGYSIDGEKAKCVDLANGECLPEEIRSAITDPNIIKSAFNANFERICLSRFLGLPTGNYLNPNSWQCTAVWSAYLDLPHSLAAVGQALNLDNKKLEEGKGLIAKFCQPIKTKGGLLKTTALNAPEDWQLFVQYNIRDVDVETQLRKRLSMYPVPDFVWDEYHIDQEINDRGVLIDQNLMRQAIKLKQKATDEATKKLCSITNLENPLSQKQFLAWTEHYDMGFSSLSAQELEFDLAKLPDADDDEVPIKVATQLRADVVKTSVSKFDTMQNVLCSDGRARGMFRFYGATRTGRWSGQKIQLQNLRRNDISNLDQIREFVKAGNMQALIESGVSCMEGLSQLVRTAFIPCKGYLLIVADFSAIEARVLAWLANEEWRMKAFAEHQDIYCASASAMFGVPVVKHGVNGDLRRKGKIAELALGYGGGAGALARMKAEEKYGLKQAEFQSLVDKWRASNPKIKQFWHTIDDAVKRAIQRKTTVKLSWPRLSFIYKNQRLFIELPSGRQLTYIQPRIETKQKVFNGRISETQEITFAGIYGTVQKTWTRTSTYGAKIVENITQAIARDLLANAMKNLRDYRIVMHIHDEVVIEAPPEISVQQICKLMCKTPAWAEGLILNADGYSCAYYQKD